MNLTFSVLLRPSFLSIKNQFALTTIASLAVHDYLKSKQVEDVKIKWPNDILVDNKKICGMLIENSIHGESINQSIVGIGLNINQTEFPVVTATSLAKTSGKSFDLNEEWNLLLEKLEGRYLQLRSGKQNELKKEYLDQLLGMNRKQKFSLNGAEIIGMIKNVSESGELLVLLDGIERSFSLKEISFVL
jgi:BirA family biotin operon repressor/biotin-[acetyl-CoA-carboxylase] ligase